MKPDHQLYGRVNNLIHTLTLSSPDDSTISFVPRTENWNVHFIRHKKRHTYVLDGKYMVTISLIREYVLDWPRARNDEPLDVTPNLYNETHTEIEVGVYLLYIVPSLWNANLLPSLALLLYFFFPSSTALLGSVPLDVMLASPQSRLWLCTWNTQ